MSKCILFVLTLMLMNVIVSAQSTTNSYRDLYADTWVATDGLGRVMPGIKEAGSTKNGHQRVVGMFYITWHTDDHASQQSPYTGDVTKVLQSDTGARYDAKHPAWKEGSYHWGEPEMGYFLSKDEYVIRKDMSMLTDAGVDVLVMDVTNAVRYWDEWDTLFTTMQKMKAEGNKVPQFCFWAFNGPVITVVQDLYDRIYKQNKYKDLWFYWEGKPLLLYNGNPTQDANGKGVDNPNPHYDSASLTDKNNPHYGNADFTEKLYKDYTHDIKDNFTLRTMWWGYYKWAGKRFVGTEDNWSFGYDLGNDEVRSMNPDSLVSTHKGKIEEAAVTPGQHPISLVGKSWSRKEGEPQLNGYDLADSAYDAGLHKKIAHPEGRGIYFQERWEEALKVDPPFLYINDWNEWTAGKYQPEQGKTTHFMRRESPYFFVDQYNAEFNRTIQPMKGGYTDNYYMQMAGNIRRYKGVRAAPVTKGIKQIKIDGRFDEWNTIPLEYRDTKGDVIHRSHNGYGGTFYTDTSGRNDIITCKVAAGNSDVFFYAETDQPLTSSEGNNWMLLLIDADRNNATGWHGYDYLINKKVSNDTTTTLMHYQHNKWVEVSKLKYHYKGNKLELAIPKAALNISGKSFSFDYHWSDHPNNLNDIISMSTTGDSAPNRRFNYRFTWQER